MEWLIPQSLSHAVCQICICEAGDIEDIWVNHSLCVWLVMSLLLSNIPHMGNDISLHWDKGLFPVKVEIKASLCRRTNLSRGYPRSLSWRLSLGMNYFLTELAQDAWKHRLILSFVEILLKAASLWPNPPLMTCKTPCLAIGLLIMGLIHGTLIAMKELD